MAIEVVSRPEKTLANGYLSRWNASKTPLIYKLSSNRFPTNNLDPISTITEYSYSLSEGGIVIADPSASNFIGVSFVKISGTQFIDGIYKILRLIDAGSFVIDGFTNESEGGGGQTAGNAQAYYKGYKGLVKVFVGSPEYHPYNANGTKPQIEIGTIDVDFNSSNIGICNVRSYIKPDLMAKFSDLQNNPNLWTSFSIEYAEIWEGSADAIYQEDLINGCNPFFGLFNTDFEDGLDDWDQLAPSGSGSFSQWVFPSPLFTATYNIVSNGETLTLPTPTNYLVDWGDGTTTNNTNQHTYTSLGVYTVKMSGVINDFRFDNTGDKDKILTVENFEGLQLIEQTFRGCSNLDITATDIPSVFGTIFLRVFNGCNSLIYNSSVGQIDVSNVTNMESTFSGATSFNQDISSWNVGNVTNMAGKFALATSFNQDISSWNVSNVTNMGTMFFNATSFNQDITTWNVSNVNTMEAMFRDATNFNGDITTWDVSNVTRMDVMFFNATSFNQDISSWNFTSVVNLANFMNGKSDANYNADYLSNLFIKLDQDLVFANMTSVSLGFGTIKYDSTGVAAYNSLISKGFIISSGGQV